MPDDNVIRIPGSTRTFHRARILAVLLLPLAMSLMAVSSVNVALHTIETGLGATPTDIQWVLSGYALAFGITLIPAGRAGDVLGRGSLFVAGLLLFVGASLACGLAPAPVSLNVARVVQGVGAGLYSPQIIGMIQEYFAGPARARAFALFGLVISVSVAIGPIVAGAIIAWLGPELGWRGAFLVNLPLGVLAVILALAWFPFAIERRRWAARTERRRVGGPRPEAIDLDPVGAVLVAATVLCVMLPFMQHPHPAIWLLLLAAAGFAALWIGWERRYAARGRAPMVDLRLFAFRSFSNGTLISGTMFVGSATVFVLVALFLQSGLGVSALETGLVGLPNAIVSGYASMWAGRRVMTSGRRIVLLGLAAMVVGSTLCIVVAALIARAGWSHWVLAVPLIFNGFGMGVVGSANQTLSLSDVPVAEGGTAGGVKQTAERIGTAIGNTVITGVLFAGHDLAGWTTGFVAGFTVIVVVHLIACWLAYRDLVQHRAPAPGTDG